MDPQKQYGDVKKLTDSGLRVKNDPAGSGPVVARPSGRPQVRPLGSNTPTPSQQNPHAPPTGIPPEHREAMVNFAEAQQAYREAVRLASVEGAGEWTRFLVQNAARVRDAQGSRLNEITPNWSISDGTE